MEDEEQERDGRVGGNDDHERRLLFEDILRARDAFGVPVILVSNVTPLSLGGGRFTPTSWNDLSWTARPSDQSHLRVSLFLVLLHLWPAFSPPYLFSVCQFPVME